MKEEISFWCKVLRNGLILSGLYFVSIWASTQTLDFYMHIKPILIFGGSYVLVEAGKRYGVEYNVPIPKKKGTLIL